MEKYDDFEEEMSDVELWISEYRETLTRWALTGDRKDAQDAFHEYVMMCPFDPRSPYPTPMLLIDTPYWCAWYGGCIADLLLEFPEQTRLLLQWAKRDRKAVHPIFAEEKTREYNIEFLTSVMKLQEKT